MPNPPVAASRQAKRRRNTACSRCARSNVKCVGEPPQKCERCIKKDFQCVWHGQTILQGDRGRPSPLDSDGNHRDIIPKDILPRPALSKNMLNRGIAEEGKVQDTNAVFSRYGIEIRKVNWSFPSSKRRRLNNSSQTATTNGNEQNQSGRQSSLPSLVYNVCVNANADADREGGPPKCVECRPQQQNGDSQPSPRLALQGSVDATSEPPQLSTTNEATSGGCIPKAAGLDVQDSRSGIEGQALENQVIALGNEAPKPIHALSDNSIELSAKDPTPQLYGWIYWASSEIGDN